MIACRFAFIIALAPAAAFAQEQSPPFPSSARPGPTVTVQDNKGAETRGRLLRLDLREAVLLIQGQEVRFDVSSLAG